MSEAGFRASLRELIEPPWKRAVPQLQCRKNLKAGLIYCRREGGTTSTGPSSSARYRDAFVGRYRGVSLTRGIYSCS